MDLLDTDGGGGGYSYADDFESSPISGRTTTPPSDSTLSTVDDTSNRPSSVKADKNDLGSFIRDLASTTLTTVGKTAAQNLISSLTRKAGAGSSPIRQGATGRPANDLFANGIPASRISVGGVPVTLTATQIQKRALGQTFNLTPNQRAALAQYGVNAPRRISSAQATQNPGSTGDPGDNHTMLYFLLAGGVVLLLFLKK